MSNSKSATQFRLEQKFQTRLYFYTGGILVIFALFIIQLGNLQLVWGYENRILAKRFVSRQEFSSIRSRREADTLTRIMELLDDQVPGAFARLDAAEVLMRRLLAIVTAEKLGDWSVASHMEETSSVSLPAGASDLFREAVRNAQASSRITSTTTHQKSAGKSKSKGKPGSKKEKHPPQPTVASTPSTSPTGPPPVMPDSP